MTKFLLKTIAAYFFLTTILFSEMINKIEVSGNKRISDETILVLGSIQNNQNFNDEQLNETLKSLYDSNFFSDININLNNGLLSISVIENPIIEDIAITGVKNKNFLKVLSENITLKNRMSFTENQLQKDINILNNILKSGTRVILDL